MASLASLLPQTEGILPYWLLITSFLSILNTIACYTSPAFFRRTYSNPFPNSPSPKSSTRSSQKASAAPESTVLPARIFGVWTLLACILRTYGAYALNKPDIYALTFSTYPIALFHFTTEWLVYGTMSPKGGLLPPFFFATTTSIWMISQWGTY